ncbi:MAG: ribbon-helix-helix domain-containing protein [Candidatus Heimdallarchaeaceae archaeon]
MKLLTIRLPEYTVQSLDELIEKGVVTSRAEGVRIAIREFYLKHYMEKKYKEE